MLAAVLLMMGAVIGLAGCAQTTTATNVRSTSIATSNMQQPTSGRTSPSAVSSVAAPTAFGASGLARQFVVPEEAKAHTKEGAVAFVTFYWNMLGQLDAHPRTGIIPKFSAEGCKTCQRWEEHNKQLLQDKAVVRVAGEHCDPGTVRPDSTADSVVVQMRCRNKGFQHISGSRTLRSYPPAASLVELRTDWSGKEWLLGEAGSQSAK